MNQDQLIAELAQEAGTTEEGAKEFLRALGRTVRGALTDLDEVTIPGVGKLSVQDRPGRTGRNPRAGETVEIAPKRVAKFKLAKALRDVLNPPA